MSRGELADAVNAALDRLYPGRDLTAHYVYRSWIGKLERGEHRWPSQERRTALRQVLGAATDTELDLYSPRRTCGPPPPSEIVALGSQAVAVTGSEVAAGHTAYSLSAVDNGMRPTLNRDAPGGSEAMKRRDFLITAGSSLAGLALHAIMAADPEYRSRSAETPSPKMLEERVNKIRQLRVSCDYENALRLVPDTVRGLHSSLKGPDWRSALRLLLLVEEAVASIVRYLGETQASAMIAERMREVARRLEDPVMASLAAFQRAHAASAIGAHDYARVVATGTMETLSLCANGRGANELLGMLMLTAAFASSGESTPNDAVTYVEEARRIANRTGETMTLSLFFGPTNIQIWELSMEVDRGDPAKAVALARNINPVRLQQIQRQTTYHIDTARALCLLGRDDDALRRVIEAERLAPAQVRSDTNVWKTVRSIVERRNANAIPPDVRTLCGHLNIAL